MSFTKFEKARIIGARALQISMGAPVIIDIP
ncbi:MAG: DNA-directed RNA polymerase subunit K, partial [Candidatus Thermoplasmatota archaeon]|nr:DNA-directed RNA polymerase subunit K [Candidatus Thermoplasmatota archaeon]